MCCPNQLKRVQLDENHINECYCRKNTSSQVRKATVQHKEDEEAMDMPQKYHWDNWSREPEEHMISSQIILC